MTTADRSHGYERIARAFVEARGPGGVGAATDNLAGTDSVSLGRDRYHELLVAEGLALDRETSDEGDNHYYLASKIGRRRRS